MREDFIFLLEFHWNLFPNVQLRINHHWFSFGIVAEQKIHYLNQWWPSFPMHIQHTLPVLNELNQYIKLMVIVSLTNIIEIKLVKWQIYNIIKFVNWWSMDIHELEWSSWATFVQSRVILGRWVLEAMVFMKYISIPNICSINYIHIAETFCLLLWVAADLF